MNHGKLIQYLGINDKIQNQINSNQMFILRNIQLQGTYKKYDLTAIHVIKRSLDMQLWIMVSGGWY